MPHSLAVPIASPTPYARDWIALASEPDINNAAIPATKMIRPNRRDAFVRVRIGVPRFVSSLSPCINQMTVIIIALGEHHWLHTGSYRSGPTCGDVGPGFVEGP